MSARNSSAVFSQITRSLISGEVNAGRVPKIVLCVQTNTSVTSARAASAPGALYRRGLRNFSDLQRRQAGPRRVRSVFGEAAVDDAAYAVDGDRGFGYVGGEHYFLFARGLHRTILLFG